MGWNPCSEWEAAAPQKALVHQLHFFCLQSAECHLHLLFLCIAVHALFPLPPFPVQCRPFSLPPCLLLTPPVAMLHLHMLLPCEWPLGRTRQADSAELNGHLLESKRGCSVHDTSHGAPWVIKFSPKQSILTQGDLSVKALCYISSGEQVAKPQCRSRNQNTRGSVLELLWVCFLQFLPPKLMPILCSLWDSGRIAAVRKGAVGSSLRPPELCPTSINLYTPCIVLGVSTVPGLRWIFTPMIRSP